MSDESDASGHHSRCPVCGLPLRVAMGGAGPELSYDFPAWNRLCKRTVLGGPSMCLAGLCAPGPSRVDAAFDHADHARYRLLGQAGKRGIAASMALSDEQIRTLLRDPANQPPSARHLGFELIDFSVGGGWAEVAFSPRPEFANPQGTVQGGFVCAMLDDAMGFTASISQRFAILVPTLQISVSYLRPTPMSRVIARGEVLRMGQATAHLQGTLRLPDSTLLATATASAVLRPFPKPG